MPTTNFKRACESFLRRMGEGNITITLASPTLIGNFSPQPKRYNDINQIYDYFWFSGQALFRAIDRLTKNEVTSVLPNFFTILSTALTSGQVTILDVERILDPVKLVISGTTRLAYRIPDSILLNVLSSSGMRQISAEYPGYYLKGNLFTSYPTTATSAEIGYIKSVPREVLDSNGTDAWATNFYSMLVDGAVGMAKGDANEIQLEQLFVQKMKANLQYYQIPISNQTQQLEQK